MIKVWFDGACKPKNPNGIATWGFIIEGEGKKMWACGVAGHGEGMTNNVAEYHGLIEALRVVSAEFAKGHMVEVYGDSQMVIKMSSKEWGYDKGRYMPHREKPHLQKLLDEVFKASERLNVQYGWLPREQNTQCDLLSLSAYMLFKRKSLGTGEKVIYSGIDMPDLLTLESLIVKPIEQNMGKKEEAVPSPFIDTISTSIESFLRQMVKLSRIHKDFGDNGTEQTLIEFAHGDKKYTVFVQSKDKDSGDGNVPVMPH